MRFIIAFDLGSHMAFAHNGGPDDGMITGNREFTGHRVIRAAETMAYLRHEFSRLQETFNLPNVAIYERPFARGQAATRSLWGIAGILEAVATGAGCAVLDATPAEIKKYATGSHKATKEEMMAAARKFGYLGDNEHEADAVCLLRYAEHYIVPEFDYG